MREQSVQERIQESLPGYNVQKSDEGYVAKAKPVRYLKKEDSRTKVIRRGEQYQYDEYSPHELIIDPKGNVKKEYRRKTYTKDATGKIREWGVYDAEVTDYQNQTRFTFGARDLKSGRESIRQTSSLEGGVYKEKRIINQDTPEYERLRRTDLQKELIRKKGFTVRRTEEYAIAGMSKDQRRQYFRLQAKQRSAQLSLDAKAQKIARMETEKFRSELGAESQKFAMNIVAQQEAQRPKSPFFISTSTGPVSSGPVLNFIPDTPASGTTRTDMGDKPFLIGGKLPPGELQVAPKPKGIVERYTRFQDLLGQKQARASARGQAGSSVALSSAQFGLGIPMGVYQFGKAVMPWNLPNTIGGMVDPQSYRMLGQQLRSQPAKTTGEITGSLLAGYGVGKGVQYAKIKKAQSQLPKGERGVGSPGKTSKDFVQTKLPTKQERFTGQIQPQELKFAQTKTGKGLIQGKVFSAKVVKDPATGKYVRTPEIGITGHRIPGDPTRLGTIYQTKTYAYAGKPIRVRPEVQQPLVKPQVVATSKWLPGDVRPVSVRYVRGQPTPFVPDYFGGTLRPFNPQEFTLSTVYKKPGLQPSQATAVSSARLSYSKTTSTPFGDISISRPPTRGVQQTLPSPKPRVITIVKRPGSTVTPLAGSVKTPSSPRVVTGGPGSQLVAKVTPKKYATAGEVIKGTLKVYPKTRLIGKAEAVSKFDLPDAQPLPKSKVPTKQNLAGTGLVQVSQYSPRQTPTPGIKTEPLIKPSVSVLQDPGVISEPRSRIDVKPESLAKYKDLVIAKPSSRQVPVGRAVQIAQPILQSETVTELRTEQVLRTEPLFDQVTQVTPRTAPTRPSDAIPVEPPPRLTFAPPKEEPEKKKRGKYKVEVREKGIFKKIGIRSTPEEAFKFGSISVQSTARASFKVTPVAGGKPVSDVGRSLLSKKIFRESKKEPGVFIERRQFRIDKPGEKREITFKGIFGRRSRSAFKL